MSVSTWDAFGGASSGSARHRQRRRQAPAGTATGRMQGNTVVVPAAVKFNVGNTVPQVAKRWRIGGIGLAVLGVAALHAAIALLWENAPATPQPVKAQVVVELVKLKPPEKIEPPKPLPQKLTPPPKALPRPVAARPTPAPTPAPVAQKAEPAAPNTPAPAVTLPAASPAPPIQAAEPPVPEAVTPPVGYAGYLHNPPPAYPVNAQRMGLEGKVILRVRVLANGKPASVEVHNSSGRKMLDEAAVAVVQNWVFTPSRRGQTPIDGWVNVPIEFKLERS